MQSLIGKEVRQLMPLLGLFCFFFGADILYVPLTDALDETTWYGHHAGLKGDGFEAFVLYAMGLTLAFSLFAREYEERTIEFLHTLPVTRWQIFLAKFLAASGILMVVIGVRELTYGLMQGFNVGSLTSHQFNFATAGKSIFLGLATAFLGLSHGLLLSVGRQFGLLLFAFLWWVLSQVEHHAPQLAFLNPASLTHPTYYGSSLLIPWKALSLHIPVGLLCLLVAHFLWAARGHQVTWVIVVWCKKWAKTVGCLTIVAVVGLFCLWAATSDPDSEEPDPKEAHFPSSETARLETHHYSFTFPVSLRQRALRLAARADALYSEASSHLGGAGNGDLVIADLTDVSSEHLGIASTEKLRMDITQNEEPALLDHVLLHETCHVLCRRLAGRRGRDYASVLGFFDEGTAEFVAYGFVKSSRDRTQSRRQAVAMKVRHRLTFEEMSDTETMHEKFAGSLDYTLGELWVAALVDSYGPGSLVKVWRAIGRPGGSKSLRALAFWQDSLQAAGLNFEVVRSAWLSRLKKLEREEAPFLAALPKLRGRAVRDPNGEILIKGQSDRAWPEGWPQMVVRIRAENADEAVYLAPDSDTPPGLIRAVVPDDYGNTFEYQFGVQFSADGYPFWEEWKSVKGL